MEDISRKDILRIYELLANHVGTDESIKLASTLLHADLIPKLYQQAYVESMHQRFQNVKNHDDEMECTLSDGYLASLIETPETLNAVKYLLQKSHDRRHEICDFDDAPFPKTIIGSCQYDDHYDDFTPDGILTEEEYEVFEELNEKYGWQMACERYSDKLNPSNQILSITLNYNDDETKLDINDAVYVCNSCMEVIAENADGSVACDLDMVDD